VRFTDQLPQRLLLDSEHLRLGYGLVGLRLVPGSVGSLITLVLTDLCVRFRPGLVGFAFVAFFLRLPFAFARFVPAALLSVFPHFPALALLAWLLDHGLLGFHVFPLHSVVCLYSFAFSVRGMPLVTFVRTFWVRYVFALTPFLRLLHCRSQFSPR